MVTVESLNLVPVWLNPEHLMSSARILMSGHGLKSLAVLQNGKLVGLLSTEILATAPEDAHVSDRMEEPGLVVEASTPVRKVAEMFVEAGVERAPVLRGDRFVGMVTSTMLLRELGRSWDPLTSLSWSDRLREWGVENLREGREIVVLFIDLDNFGAYNKRYGHVIGDNVLRKVVDLLRSACEGYNCILVRYGGDEFAIGLTGIESEGQQLADMLRRRSSEVRVDGVPDPVTFSVGMAGGKRTKERENVHYAATMDNLINLASRDCIEQKKSKPRPVAVAEEAPSHLEQEAVQKEAPVATAKSTARILSVYAEENSPTSQVVVSVDNGVVSGVSARGGRSVLESVAVATCKALERAYPGTALEVEAVNLSEGPEGQRLVTVSGHMDKGQGAVNVGGVHEVERDLYTGVAEATLQAFAVL